ncbi:hypothetical protein RF11_00450 [Thelohanellus kitauei]|uniref:Uncharacterized protein n=1 Tax=Thelohanellus kitauei TaxID=669202 RepID=A0A0C2MS78_THEKT|nr:hypothetical protein RF11_00450 [Thelohanellus kitauei]
MSTNIYELHTFINISRFHVIRDELILLESQISVIQNTIIGISRREKDKDITTKIKNFNQLGMRTDLTIFSDYRTYFYAHGNFYILVWKNISLLCLYTFDANDQLNELICDLYIYDGNDERCPIVIDPRSVGVIYANLKVNEEIARTYISFDNGKNFSPVEKEDHGCKCRQKNCLIELELRCSNDFITNHFPAESIKIFQGNDHKAKHYGSFYNFVLFNRGKSWNKFYLDIENLTIFNNGGLLLGKGGFTGQIMYSFDQGRNWYKEGIILNDIIGIIPLEARNNQLFAVIDYNREEKVYKFFIFDFSKTSSYNFLIKGSNAL